jgi:hypothetical protein
VGPLERSGTLFLAAKETELVEFVGESREDFLGDEDFLLLRRAAADGLERGLPVELGNEEVLERLHPEIAVRARVLDDEIGRALLLDGSDDEVGAKLELAAFDRRRRAEGVPARAAVDERAAGIDHRIDGAMTTLAAYAFGGWHLSLRAFGVPTAETAWLKRSLF